MPNLVGQDLGRYHIIEQLGEGGMATVYKAFDARLERHVALKIIRADVGEGPEMLKRFEREAKALAQLTHPNIVHINDYGEQGGMPYVVMDYLPGGTLKQKLGQPLAYDEAARLLAPIARALEYAHQQKIVHRDVKPANILLTQSGDPMLTDFGIAKILEGGKQHTELTATGVGLGTPDYMAPEQWFGKAEARTDIYALGIVFYELVTGRRPFAADTPAAVLIKHMNDPLPDPRQFAHDLPGRVEQVLFRALAKSVDDRYQTMGEFAAALERLSAPPRQDRTQMAAPLAAAASATVLVPPTPGPATSGLRLSQSQSVARAQPVSQPAIRTQAPARPAVAPPPAQARSGLPRNVLITLGAVALLAICAVGGIAGGLFIYSQINPTASTATPTTAPRATAVVPEPTAAASLVVPSVAPTLPPSVAPTIATSIPPSSTPTAVPPTLVPTHIPPTRTAKPAPPTPVPPTPVPPTAVPTTPAPPTLVPTVPSSTPLTIIVIRPTLRIFLLPSPTPTLGLIIIKPIIPIIKP